MITTNTISFEGQEYALAHTPGGLSLVAADTEKDATTSGGDKTFVLTVDQDGVHRHGEPLPRRARQGLTQAQDIHFARWRRRPTSAAAAGYAHTMPKESPKDVRVNILPCRERDMHRVMYKRPDGTRYIHTYSGPDPNRTKSARLIGGPLDGETVRLPHDQSHYHARISENTVVVYASPYSQTSQLRYQKTQEIPERHRERADGLLKWHHGLG